jgi:hypothetical protein
MNLGMTKLNDSSHFMLIYIILKAKRQKSALSTDEYKCTLKVETNGNAYKNNILAR